MNSPYNGYATSGVADPSKVWLTGRGLKEAMVREEAEFTIDASQAGPGTSLLNTDLNFGRKKLGWENCTLLLIILCVILSIIIYFVLQ